MSFPVEQQQRSCLVAPARRLHHWAALLLAFLPRLFSSLFPTSGASLSPPCSSRPSSSSAAVSSARLVKDSLRVETYGEVSRRRTPRGCPPRGAHGHPDNGRGRSDRPVETCAVCLGALRPRDRVRVPNNCRHVYHRRCLDRWIDHHEQGTCPLCRAPLLASSPPTRRPSHLSPAAAAGHPEQEEKPSWAVEQLLYLFGDDLLPSCPASPPSSSSHCSR